jgi:HlyD family secretion protein
MSKLGLRPSQYILPILAFAGVLFAIYSVFLRPTEAAKLPASPPVSSTYGKALFGIGVIEPKSEIIRLGVEIPGVVREVYVKVGDEVTAGQALFALDQRDVEAQIKSLNASLSVAKVEVSRTKAAYDLIKAVDNPAAVSKDEINQRRFAFESSVANQNQIEAQIDAQTVLQQRLTISAPINGRILQINVRPGEFANANQGAGAGANEPLVIMGDVSQLHVRVEIDESQAQRLNKNATAYGMLRGEGSRKIPLNIVRFEPYARAKQNLAVAGQSVDTRVVQVIMSMPAAAVTPSTFVGAQMDVFIQDKTTGG